MARFPLVVLLSAPLALLAGQAGPARSDLEQFAAQLDTLHARFEQTITSQDGVIESEGSGEVWLKSPGLFRWVYAGEYPELIVADGQRVWLYDEILEQVTVKPQSGLAENSPLMLLTDIEALDEQFEVREVGDHEGMNLLQLVSINAESEFDQVLLGFRGGQLALMQLEDAFGLRTSISFSEVLRNPELAEALFQFTPPPDADVVGETEVIAGS